MVKDIKNGFSDEQLMAFADGECDAAMRAQIEVALKADPTLSKRVEMFRHGTQLLKTAFKPVADKRADDALAHLIRSNQAVVQENATTNVVQFPKPKNAEPMVWQKAIAATVLLAIGVSGGYLFATPKTGQNATMFALAPAVQSLLSTLPSGSAGKIANEELVIIASFKDEKGHFCREFESVKEGSEKLVTVACQKDSAWRVLFQVAMPSTIGSFVPAGGDKALEVFLASSGMEEPLTVDAEASLLRKP